MSIVIDSNLMYLQSRLQLSAEKLQQYQNKTVEEILETEIQEGNPLAIALANELLTNVNLLIEIFKLSDPNNRYEILSNMNSQQLNEFLPLMEKTDLNYGLMYFTQDKLLKMLEQIPPEQLVNTVLQLFSQEEVIKFMPQDQLDKFITNNTLDKNKVLEHLKSLPPEYLTQIIENATGKPAEEGLNSVDLTKQIAKLNPLEYNDALTSLQPTQKQQVILGLVKEDEKLYQLFDPHAYTKMIDEQKQKPEIVKAMHVIEKDEMIKMLKELPNDLLAMVVTQLDKEVFADNLMKKNPEIIAQLLIA